MHIMRMKVAVLVLQSLAMERPTLQGFVLFYVYLGSRLVTAMVYVGLSQLQIQFWDVCSSGCYVYGSIFGPWWLHEE